jgi:hypothetical protein
LLNNIAWTLTTGYGNTLYQHDLKGFYLYQDPNGQFIRSKAGEVGLPELINGYYNWLNDPQLSDQVDIIERFDVPYDRLDSAVFNPRLNPVRLILDGDTANIKYESAWSSIPINLSGHYDFMNFRFGIGGSYERQWSKIMNPIGYEDQIRAYAPNFNATNYWRAYGILGYRIYDYWDYALVGELQVGKIWGTSQFNKDLINRSVFVNVGLSFEHIWSEYFRIIVRPSYEIKQYTINLPAAQDLPAGSLVHNYNSFFIQAGVSINIPEIRRSPINNDHVQLKHVITDPVTGRLEEVRGQPIWKKQNPKVGENHRKLHRYRWRNKKKLNPY